MWWAAALTLGADQRVVRSIWVGVMWGMALQSLSGGDAELLVQVRGSIPIYWTQNSLQRRLKPEIQLQRHDPLYAPLHQPQSHLLHAPERYRAPAQQPAAQ